MKLKVLACYDSKAGVYSTPFFQPTVNTGMRAFSDAANTPDHSINKHPEDYCLFLLGDWDDETGVFTPLADPKSLGKATNFKKEENDHVRKVA